MKAMNKVASHINDMQKIHEEFGAVFDQLITEQSGDKKEVRGCILCGHTFLYHTIYVTPFVGMNTPCGFHLAAFVNLPWMGCESFYRALTSFILRVICHTAGVFPLGGA